MRVSGKDRPEIENECFCFFWLDTPVWKHDLKGDTVKYILAANLTYVQCT